jgi:cbb3-type cytochrome oxidase cytochrome c subunit
MLRLLLSRRIGNERQIQTSGGVAMNHGPFVFLGVLVAFLASWWTFIFSSYLQLGPQQPAAGNTGVYPIERSGIAQQGKKVYVANGCVQCHSQQAQQTGFTFDVVLTGAGTNAAEVAQVLATIARDVRAEQVLASASDKNPQVILRGVDHAVAASAATRLNDAGAAAQSVFVPLGADMRRGWGSRRSVAADYLYDYPVQAGHSRLGPDLANYGNRAPDLNTILVHLYEPRATVEGSIMPAYRFLFEERAIGVRPSPDALQITGRFAPASGREIVPKPEALQLAAYLMSLRLDTPLFEAPAPQLVPVADAGTNAPANAPANATPAP